MINRLDSVSVNNAKLIAFILLFTTCLIGAPVYATSISQTQSFNVSDGPKSVDLPFATTSTLTFNKFDNSLGTLMNLSIDFTGSLQAAGGATLVNPHPCTAGTGGAPDPGCIGSVSGSLTLSSLTSSLVIPSAFAIPTVDFSGTPSGGDSCNAVSPDASCVLSTGAVTSTTFHFSEPVGPSSTTAVDRSFLIGPGSYDFLFDAHALFSSLASSGATVIPGDGGLNWTGSAQVTYSYDPTSSIPEPGTLLLLGVGLAGIRFRKRVQMN